MSAARYEANKLRPFFEVRTHISETPSDKYTAYYQLIHSNGLAKLPRTYFTTTITSGGFNIFAEQKMAAPNGNGNINFFSIVVEPGTMKMRTPLPASLSFPEILKENVELAEAFRIGLLDSGRVSTDKSLLIFPPDLGKVPGWTQFDYNLFWLDVISGLNPKDAREIESAFRESKFDFKTYNDSKLPNEIRKRVYLEFVQIFLQMIEQKGYHIDPISEFIQLVDPKGSLGGFVEEFLAKSLGVHISWAMINNMKTFSGEGAARTLIKQGVDIPAARLGDKHDDPVLLVSQRSLFDKPSD